MKLSILHLSDIHLHSSTDSILLRASEIASTAFSNTRSADACLILVTGDIAFSGSSEQYDLAKQFLDEIRDAILSEGCPIVDIFMVPGNHDCSLVPENTARTIVIERLSSDIDFAEDEHCIDICVSAQKNYFKFRTSVTKELPIRDAPLWSDYELAISGKVVRISAINASWMSRIPETPGNLVFPTHQFQGWLLEPAELRIALIHHPLNWYSQSSYHPLRTALRTNCSIVLSGHEHVNSGGEITEFGCKRQLFYEAPALQPHNTADQAGFSLLMFDTENNVAIQNQYQLESNVIKRGKVCETSLDAIFRGDVNSLLLTKEFERILRDPGGGFGHPDKEHLEIDDVFVYPELRVIDRDPKDKKEFSVSSEEILFQEIAAKKILLIGEDKIGKTTLLLRAFKEFHSQGLAPLYIQASSMASFSSNEISKALDKAVKDQYEDSLAVDQTEKVNRICLLDDFDRVRGGTKNLIRLISELESHFDVVIVTASQGFEIKELVNADAAKALGKYQSYEISRFGNALRHRLIRKWCQLGFVNTLPELDRIVHNTEAVVNAVVSRNLTPSLPFYLLILLQSYSQQQQGEIQNSGFARYYEYLMTRSLSKSGIKKDEFDELFNYLSQLAWLFRNTDKEELSKQELIAFTRQYAEKYISVDLDSRLNLLQNARLLNARGNYFQFAYPYVYFFFLGRYLAKNLADPEIKSKVSSWCRKLYLRKNSHAIIFLSYHSNDDWIIEQISGVLDGCFSDKKPIEFNGDVASINNLVDSTSRLLIEEPNIAHNQEATRRRQDEVEENLQEDKDYPENGEAAILGNINLLLKTSEILGQIIKNYYGSMERVRKEELISKVISGPLRLLNFFMQHLASDPDAFVLEMEKIIEHKYADLDEKEKRNVARKAAFQILSLISAGIIVRTAEWVGSERLEEDVAKVVERNGTVAFRLVEVGTRLLLPRDLAIDQIRKVAEELEHNPFSFGILQTIALRHLHLFYIKATDRQRLCSILKIDVKTSRAIDIKTQSTKLLDK